MKTGRKLHLVLHLVVISILAVFVGAILSLDYWMILMQT